MRTLGYRPALDGLRAVAITAVVMVHAVGFPAGGALGVDLFFVLSGFLITTLLLEERARTGAISLAGFYRRRALRLLPALGVFLAVYLAVALVFSTTTRESAAVHVASALGGAVYVSNVMWATGFDPANALVHLWSLSAEEQFYLVWPALLLGLLVAARGRLRPILVLLVAGVVAVQLAQLFLLLTGAPTLRIVYGPDTRAGSIIVGCLLTVVMFGRETPRVDGRVLAVALALFTGILFVGFGTATFSGPLLFFSLACACLILAALDSGSRLAIVLSVAPVVFLGRISYSLYLWHMPILAWVGTDDTAFALVDLVAVVLVLGAATASYYLVERPLLRLKRSPRRAPAAQPSTEMASALA